jgi:acyl-[acyl-carrier-protein]-phospholipid O-acyltransferase/long-chain-fatty-acid--[acyl-carrier-protein] ligase
LAKAKIEEIEGMVFLEEVMKRVTPFQKVQTTVLALLFPSRLLQALYTHEDQKPDSLATIIFSSGSTGIPKGVMLSHHNILSNVEGLAQVFWVTNKDRLMGVLPFFHSFGFTGSLWFPLLSGFGVVYHSNPLDRGNDIDRYPDILCGIPPEMHARGVFLTPDCHRRRREIARADRQCL